MQHNPYSPPSAEVYAAPVHVRARKPKSAWFTQIICVIGLVLQAIGIAATISVLVTRGPAGFENTPRWALFGYTVLRAAMLLILISTLWGIHKRKLYGRISGGLLIAIFLVWFAYQLLFVNGSSAMDDAAAMGQFTAKMLFACGTGYWFYAFCFSPAAQRYFSGNSDDNVENDG